MEDLNLSAIMAAYIAHEKALDDLAYYTDLLNSARSESGYLPRRVEESTAEVKETLHALDLAAVPLDERIRDGEGEARIRTLSAFRLLRALREVEKHLDLAPSNLKGVRVTVNVNHQSFPNAYKRKGTPESTFFTARHNGNEWFLIRVYRATCTNTFAQIELPEETKAALVRRAERMG